jgi:hypothetical protein
MGKAKKLKVMMRNFIGFIKIKSSIELMKSVKILWSVDPLLGTDLYTDNEYSRCYAIGR